MQRQSPQRNEEPRPRPCAADHRLAPRREGLVSCYLPPGSRGDSGAITCTKGSTWAIPRPWERHASTAASAGPPSTRCGSSSAVRVATPPSCRSSRGRCCSDGCASRLPEPDHSDPEPTTLRGHTRSVCVAVSVSTTPHPLRAQRKMSRALARSPSGKRRDLWHAPPAENIESSGTLYLRSHRWRTVSARSREPAQRSPRMLVAAWARAPRARSDESPGARKDKCHLLAGSCRRAHRSLSSHGTCTLENGVLRVLEI